jgi:hypothetical protein
MKKKLVSSDNIGEFLAADAKEIHVDTTMILTSSAKDYLRSKGVKVIYGSKTAATSRPVLSRACSKKDSLKTVVTRIVSILRNDLQVRDSAKVERVTQKVLSSLQGR